MAMYDWNGNRWRRQRNNICIRDMHVVFIPNKCLNWYKK